MIVEHVERGLQGLVEHDMTYERVSHNKVTTSLIVHIMSVTISAQGLRFQRFQCRVSCSRCVLRDRNSRSQISTHGSAAVGYAGPMPWRTCRDAKLHCDAACTSACAVRAAQAASLPAPSYLSIRVQPLTTGGALPRAGELHDIFRDS